MCHYHFHLFYFPKFHIQISTALILTFSRHSFIIFSLHPFASAIWTLTSWVEPSLILSGALPISSICISLSFSYHFICYSHIFSRLWAQSLNFVFSNLFSNDLTGAIPISIGNLTDLQNVYVLLQFSLVYQRSSFILIALFLTSFHDFSVQFSRLLTSYLASWIPISWVEPFLIRSGTLPICSSCMYHYHSINHINTSDLAYFIILFY